MSGVEKAARPAPGRPGRLAHVTREQLEPVWARRDIPTRRMAEALGVTREALRQRAAALGLPPRTGNQVPNTRADAATFRRMWLAGVSTAEMARHFGYAHRCCVGQRRRALGLPARTRGPGGRAGGWRETITLAEFAEMEMARLMAGETAGGST